MSADRGRGAGGAARTQTGAEGGTLVAVLEQRGRFLAADPLFGDDRRQGTRPRSRIVVSSDRARDGERARPGAIVLLHDSPRYADRATAQATAEAIPLIAAAAAEQALEWVTLGEALAEPDHQPG